MRSDTYVHNFKHAIEAYYKGVQVSDYTKRNHFLEALSGQQRNAIGCQKIGGTYESMVKAFRRAYKVSRFNTVTEWTNIRRELLAAQQADKQTLLAADRLVSTKQFAWHKQRGGPMQLLRQPKAPNVATRAVLLLPPAYRQAAMKALHEDTRRSAADNQNGQRQISLARPRARHQEVCQVVYCVPEIKNQQA